MGVDEVEVNRQLFQWWINTTPGRPLGFEWRPFPKLKQATAPGILYEMAWIEGLPKLLAYSGLLRCRSLFQFSYVSGQQKNLRCLVDWAGHDWRISVPNAIQEEKLWPRGWPTDPAELAVEFFHWHVQRPVTEPAVIAAILTASTDEEKVLALAKAVSSQEIEICPPRVQFASVDGQAVFGTDEQSIRSDIADDPFVYPFGTAVPKAPGKPKRDSDLQEDETRGGALSDESDEKPQTSTDDGQAVVRPETDDSEKDRKSRKPWKGVGPKLAVEYVEACRDAGKKLRLAPWVRGFLANRVNVAKWKCTPETEIRRLRDNKDEWYPALQKLLRADD
jgi:hypothetical protein